MRIRSRYFFIALFAAVVLMLTGCAFSGTSYLALDYSTGGPITYLYFPALPSIITWGRYYQHSEGTYSAQYENIVFYDFTYTIRENPGSGFIFGVPGDDRYYTMWLETAGPELFFFDVSASLAGKTSKASTAEGGIKNAPIDKSRYDLAHPEPFSHESSSNGVTFQVTGNRYQLK